MSLLAVKDLSIHFGGVKAVQNVSFNIDAGIVYSVIGPNGAGKTTLFNLITGVYKPTTGEIKLDGEAIHGKSPNELAVRGVARTFQNLQICMNMSAIENVMVGAHLRLDRNLVKAALRFPSLKARDRELRDEAAQLMDFVGLAQYVETRADAMSFGALKRLAAAGKKIIIRVPLIPGFNADEASVTAITNFAADELGVDDIHFLPYHTLGMNKYTLLGQPYSAPDKPLDNPALLDFAQQYACQKGLTATLRG